MHLFRKIKRATLASHFGKQALLFDFIIVLSEVIIHYFAAIYLCPYDKSVTRFRIVFEGQKCDKLRILASFSVFLSPYFCLKIYFISRLSAVSLPKIQEIMIKKLYRHIAMRYKYWRYRRLLRKLFRKYSKDNNDVYDVIRRVSDEFFWWTGEHVPKDWNDHQYFWYL